MAHDVDHTVVVDALYPQNDQREPDGGHLPMATAKVQVQMKDGRIEIRLPPNMVGVDRFRILPDDLQYALDNVNFLPALRKDGVGKRFGHPVTGSE